MAKCAECKKSTPDEMSFVVDKGICPYCGGKFLDPSIVEGLTEKIKKGFLNFENDEEMSSSKKEIIRYYEDRYEAVIDSILDDFELYPKGTMSTRKNVMSEPLNAHEKSAPKPLTRQMSSGNREGGGVPDASMYQEAFNEDADIYDGALVQTAQSGGETFTVTEESGEGMEIGSLKEKARMGAKFAEEYMARNKERETL